MDHVYKKIEVTGSSATSFDDAVRTAIARASETVHRMRWFEVSEARGAIEEGVIGQWQVTLKIGFRIDE